MRQTFKMLLAILMLLSLAMVPGCGSRKSSLNKQSSSSKSSDKTEESREISSSSSQTNQEQVVQQNDNTSENSTTVIEEEFPNPLPGQPSKRKTTTTKGSLIDKSKTSSSKASKDTTSTNVKEDIERVKEAQANAASKDKQTDADKTIVNNVGGPWVIIVIVCIVVAAIFSYFYWKKK